MRQYLFIIITVVVVIVLLVALNAASYVRLEQEPDTEYNPDRSTYNAGATGTRALYDYLQETGHKVVRWREKPEKLFSSGNAGAGTFVVVGDTRIGFESKDAEPLLLWVAGGGRLVIIDRTPDPHLLPASGNWRLSAELQNYPTPDVRSDNADEMTAGVSLVRASQPSLLVLGVDSALPSRFASTIKLWTTEGKQQSGGPAHNEDSDEDDYAYEDESEYDTPPPPVAQASPGSALEQKSTDSTPSPAPVVHMSDSRGAILVDYSYGNGRIILLSDPFIIANGGINRADNLRLATNVVAGNSDALIVFDEYHHGRAATQNELIGYFAGTPILAMLGQLGLVVLVIVWTSGRRFARPLPLPFVDRRSKLEFVASMAELQQRARAYDLAIENVYTRTRRVLIRYAGLDSQSPRAEIAARVAARSKLNAAELEALMRECEDSIAGEPVSARKALQLVSRLREVERDLGLRMRSREIKQAKER